MIYDTKLIIDGVEIGAGAEENAPAIFSIKLTNTACSSPLQLGAVTTDCLDVVITNPYTPSFDGSTIELWVSPEESSELDAVAEITDLVSDESTDEVIDVAEATDGGEEEIGIDLTADERAEVAEVEETETIDQFELFEGEELSETIEDVVIDDSEWHKVGVYHVVNQTPVANGVRLIAYDNLSRLAIPFSLDAKHSLQDEYNRLVRVLSAEDIRLEAAEMPDRAVGINHTGTCRDALSYFAGLLGGFASCDENGVIAISMYTVSDAVLINEELMAYVGASAGEMTVGGFVLKSQNGTEIASIGDGQSISVVNPLMIESDLEELMAMYAGLRFEGATISARWNEALTAGSLLRVFTRDEYENYLKLMNNEVMSDEIKSMANSLGKVIVISSQVITFGSEATTIITSVCNSESDKIIQAMSRPADDKIAAAGKTATNYLNQDETGALVISNDVNDSNLRLDSDSVDIRNGDEVVATFGQQTTIEAVSGQTRHTFRFSGDDGLRLTSGDTEAESREFLSAMTSFGAAWNGYYEDGKSLSLYVDMLMAMRGGDDEVALLYDKGEKKAALLKDGSVEVNQVNANKIRVNGGPLFKTATTTTTSRSWAAKGTALAQYSYKPDAIEGYTAIALVGACSNNTNVTVSAYYDGSVVRGHAYNHNTSAVSTNLVLRFLYVADGLI